MRKTLNNLALPASPVVWLGPILVVSALLRVYKISAVALWSSEAIPALYIRYSWTEMLRRITHSLSQPLYFMLLKLWSLVFHSSALSLRGFSAVFGILTVYAGYLFVKEAFANQKLAILAALLLAINPLQIQYSTQVGLYTLSTFLVLFSSYLLVKALQTNKTTTWVWYAISVAACFYTHYFLFLPILAQGLYFLYYNFQQKRFIVKGFGSYILSLGLFASWVPTLIKQIKQAQSVYAAPSINHWSIQQQTWEMLFRGQFADRIVLAIATFAALALLVYFFRETKQPARWFIVLNLFICLAASVALSQTQLIASLFFTILFAAVLFLIPKYTTRRLVVILFAAFSIFLFVKNWRSLDVKNNPGMAVAVQLVNASAQPNDKIYIGSKLVYYNFEYYNRTSIRPRLISETGADDSLLDSADVISNDIIFNHPEVKKGDNVWLVWTTAFDLGKPNVPGSWQKTDEQEFSDTPEFKGHIVITKYHIN